MTAIEAMKRFNSLTKEKDLDGAVRFIKDLSEEKLTSFTRSVKAQVVEFLRDPKSEFIQKAMVNDEWIDADSEYIDKCLIKERAQIECAASTNESEEKPKKEKKKRGRPKKARKSITLGELADGMKEASPEAEKAVEAAKEVGADKVELETDEPQEPPKEPEKESDEELEVAEQAASPLVLDGKKEGVEALNAFLERQEEESRAAGKRSKALGKKFDKAFSALSKEILEGSESDKKDKDSLDAISNAVLEILETQKVQAEYTKSLNLKMDRTFDAISLLGARVCETKLSTFLQAVNNVSNRDTD